MAFSEYLNFNDDLDFNQRGFAPISYCISSLVRVQIRVKVLFKDSGFNISRLILIQSFKRKIGKFVAEFSL